MNSNQFLFLPSIFHRISIHFFLYIFDFFIQSIELQVQNPKPQNCFQIKQFTIYIISKLKIVDTSIFDYMRKRKSTVFNNI